MSARHQAGFQPPGQDAPWRRGCAHRDAIPRCRISCWP